MTKSANAVFTIYYGPRPSPQFYPRSQEMLKRVRRPWMVGASVNCHGDWAPGVQRTLIGALWAAWLLYRRLAKSDFNEEE